MSAILHTRLEKAATDNGFDLGGSREADWIHFRSSHSPLRLWLRTSAGGAPVIAFSQLNVLTSLDGFGTPFAGQLPDGARGGLEIRDFATLHSTVRRAFQLSRSLPHELLRDFQVQTETLPRSTEAERMVIQRVGQDIFRGGLLEYWDGRCAVSGLAVAELLRASHIKPWADCTLDAERLDIFNGILLAPQYDAAFDVGLITFGADATVLVSATLSEQDRKLIGLDRQLTVNGLKSEHQRYLTWHRTNVFKQW